MEKNIGDETTCYSYFNIQADDFDPEYITHKLGLEPFKTIKRGTSRKAGHGEYNFSSWGACKQTEPVLSADEQCLTIVRALKEKIPLLLEIKQEFETFFHLEIVPYIHNGQAPAIVFNREIIEFCYLTGAEIDVDIYSGWDEKADLFKGWDD